MTRALLTVNPYTLGGLPFSGKAAWNVASRAALMVPSAVSPSHRNHSAPDPRPVSRLGSNFGGSDRFVLRPLAWTPHGIGPLPPRHCAALVSK